MKKILIDGYEYLKGENIPFVEESIFDLKVGDKIATIGDKTKRSSSARSDEFKTFVIYAGTILLAPNEKRMAFLIPRTQIVGFNLFNPETNVYKLYDFNNEELFCNDYHDITFRIYQPIFEKAA